MRDIEVYRQLQAIPREQRLPSVMQLFKLPEHEARDYIQWLWSSFYRPPVLTGESLDSTDSGGNTYVTQINQIIQNTLNLHVPAQTAQTGGTHVIN